jgi:PAS domain S-box-containing protein
MVFRVIWNDLFAYFLVTFALVFNKTNMHSRVTKLIIFLLLPTLWVFSQPDIPGNSFFENLSHHEKESLLNDWINESGNRKKWSHQARLNFAQSAYENSEKDSPLRMKAMYCLAELYFNEGRFSDAFAFYDTLAHYAEQYEDHRISISVNNFRGNIYRFKGDYYSALDVLHNALQLAEREGIENLIPVTLNNLGVVYRILSDGKKASELHNKALQYAENLKDTSEIIQSYNNLGYLKWVENNIDKAHEYYDKGYKLALVAKDIHHLAHLNNNLGNIYRENYMIEDAQMHYNKALDYLNEVTLVGLKAVILSNLGTTYKYAGDNDKAIEYFNQSLEITQSIELNRFTRDNYLLLSQIYHEQGIMPEAYATLNRYVEINQKLFNDQLISSINYFNERIFEAEKKEQEYMFKLERNLLLLIIIALALIFMGTVAIILFKSFKSKRQHIEKLKTIIREKDRTEAALRQSEENYQTFIRTLNEGLIVLDLSNKIEFLNQKACKVLGCELPENIIGASIESFLFTPEDEKIFRDKMELQKIGISDNYELQIRNVQGDVLWLNISSAPILDLNQNAKGSVNLITDVTERKQTEQNYNDLTTNLNQKIKQLNCMYDISDISGVPGITFEEIIEKSLEIIPVGLKYSHDIAVQIMFNDKMYSSKNYKETPWSYTVPIKVQKKKLGYLKVLYLEEKPTINRDAFHFNEKILLKNISEKFGQILEAKNMERILRESQEKLQEVQKLARIGNWEKNLITNQYTFSETFYEITEITTEKRKFFDIERFFEIIHPDDRNILEELNLDLKSQDTRPIVNINYRIITSKGTIKYIYSTRKIVKDDVGEAIRCVYTVQDITEQKVNQELKYNIEVALKTAEAKQQFLANMSHEMRTPMNGIMGMVDFLLKTELTPEQYDFTQTIKDSSEGLLDILNDILDLSKIEAGKFQIKTQTFNLEPMLERIKGLFAALTKHKELVLKIELDKKIPEKIVTDENRLYQVITNLVSNAVKFSDTGEIILSVTLESALKDQLVLLVEVKDNGPGIKESEIDTLFIPFNQLDDISVKKNEGTGLGLAISKKLVELLGGNIGVENNKDKGCTFYFTFTACIPRVKYPKNGKPKEEVEIINKDLSGIRVLCVDDKKVNQKVVTLMLTHVNCIVSLASNGKEALDNLDKNEFDIILLDIVMPEMDGIETIKEIKKRFPNHPPVIALSANVMEGDKEEYLASGMNDYISKPVHAEELYQKITFWNNYRLAKQLKKVE